MTFCIHEPMFDANMPRNTVRKSRWASAVRMVPTSAVRSPSTNASSASSRTNPCPSSSGSDPRRVSSMRLRGYDVHPEAVLIGDVHVGAGAYVGPLASMRGDFGRIELGAGANLQDSCVMHSFPGAGCTVEPEGHIGHGAVLHGCTVRSGAMVGMNAVVMDGADIGP